MKSSRHTVIAFLGALSIGALACACTTAENSEADSSTLAIALPFKPVASMSPYSDDAVLNTRMGIAETLVTLDSEGIAQPKLAERWSTPEPNTVMFTLREGVTFHDGAPLNAEAVVTSLQHAWDATSRPKGLGKKQLTFEATADNEVTITSETADPILVQRFADPGTVILSPDAFEAEPPELKGNGTGPFELKEASVTSANAAAYSDYWDGSPAVSTLNVEFIEDGGARSNAVRASEVSLAQAVPIAQLGNLGEVELESTPLPRGVYLHLNSTKGVFTDPALRAAAAKAVDTTAIVDGIYEGHAGQTHGSLFSEKAQWAQDAHSHNHTEDAGDPTGKTISLATWTERPELGEVASVVADQLRAAGFEVNVTTQDYKSMEANLLDGAYDAVIGSRNYQSGAADPIEFLASDYSCEGSYNLSRYCNPEIDSEIDKAREISDLKQRYAEAAAIGGKIVADNAVVPLAHEYSINAYNGVSDLYFDPFERNLITNRTNRS